ncbi:glycosyltransferase family 25 protein [Rhizobium sp. G187]|uniref:glycosyltransferase family 25 protein n=1 Tax=Rhizobium sp. G187 TaxID=3451352 RepID=UPI003EE7AFA5
MRAYIIHLDRATSRRENVESLVKLFPDEVVVVSAIDAKELSSTDCSLVYKRLLHFPPYPFKLSTAEIACFLSHRMVWKKIAEDDEHGAIVLEDDVFLDSALFEEALSIIRQSEISSDFVRLPCKSPGGYFFSKDPEGSPMLFSEHFLGLGMQAQYVSKAAAERLLAMSETFDRPVDTLIQLRARSVIKVETIYPCGVFERSANLGGSTIGSKKKIFERLYRELMRPLYKLALLGICIRGAK